MADGIDLSLLKGTPLQREQTSSALLNGLKTRGGVKLKNHGLSDKLVYDLFDWASARFFIIDPICLLTMVDSSVKTRKFFALPYEDKMIAKHPPMANPNRGYCYVGQESISTISGYEKGLPQDKFVRDIKETVDFGSPRDTLVDNIWVPEEKLPGFRKFMEDFYETCFKLELEILAALAKALGVDEQQMVTLHNKAENEFRILHYPEVSASELADGTATRIAEHTDFGSITMLFQDSVGGLQVEDQQNPGVFRGIESADKTEIILNIGDSMQRLTNDTFRAACHRVTYPPSVKTGVDEAVIPERFSIAYFAKPNRTASLFPFKEFITPSTPCRYDDLNAWDYQNLRISKLFR
ncbi:leucoanthocyanidin dioxygenase [Penicillium verhagenii]|uniref:leucoanthocyanidin dioxygenase n=1 Tax=Penicillium verhagenii TaxID=1562060 RepID=UPI002544F2EA|nr:leucoanthocyanidin dioxygenase [Penicillium verhagenii]KAJ5918626.1 leucoanthocyanidin dioxygenase [Penicillium verhagenii]